MSQKNSAPCRKNLTVDIKLWYSEIDCNWHGTLLGYEDTSHLHSIKSDTVKGVLTQCQERISAMMEHEAKSN